MPSACRILSVALLPAHFAVVAMGVMRVGTFGWGLVAHSVARAAFTVGLLLASLAIVATMIIATLVATVAVARGRRVGSQLVDR